MNVSIIERRKDDCPELRNLFLKVRQATFLWTDSSTFSLMDFDKATQGEYILVALSDDKLIGFISVWLTDHFIHHLYVDESYHNCGVGTKLLNKVIEEIGLPLGLKCLEVNQKALEFYKRKGFVEKEKGISEDGAYIYVELQHPQTKIINKQL